MNYKLLAGGLLAAVAALSGCRSVDINANHDYQGKVWRAEVYSTAVVAMSFADEDSPKENVAAFIKRTGWSKEIAQGMRQAPIRFREADWAGTWHWARATLPDSMDTADVQKGAIVDVMLERSLDFHYPSYRINRVVRLVCKATDAECVERIKKEKSLNTVIAANPAPGDLFGNTYSRKMTEAEAEAFNKSLKK